MRWLLLDEVLAIDRRVAARTRSRVPKAPYSTELLMLEMMAQTGALLLGAESDFRDDVVFAKIESADFSGDGETGEPIIIEARSENLRAEGAWLDASIHHSKRPLAQARLLLMSVGRLVPDRTEPVTFHKAFMDFFHIRDKVK